MLSKKEILLDNHYPVVLKYLVSELKKADKKRDNATKKLMDMNERENMQSHTTQRYWKTSANVEFYEKEVRKLVSEINSIIDIYDIKNKIHQERFYFIKSVDNLLH
ncbi:hypothetical protein phiSHEF5_22 [Enterococcus phage phiSHEF5]|uniref:Uncharacterized protein n=1 Tax=Enterococcus phage phiSHEF5 TaxID=2030924 RepID=A0A249XUP3_9CAUD|nr:hypothetical protein FDI50_gp22 [Enterococcus phage phiSHEF5]ASZ75678.1 hypothetical protein phiSHEF5_22 [Enterococcus phage phiSHEF5]